jgi:hypothetical protein
MSRRPSYRKNSPTPEKGRLNLLIEPELKDWIHKYADKNGISVSAMVVNFFKELRDENDPPKIRQI